MNLSASRLLLSERRSKPRTICDYPAVVRGWDAQGRQFTENGRVINLSSVGIFFVAAGRLRNCSEVHVRVALPTGSLQWGSSNLAMSGSVVRSEEQFDGGVGLAIQFHQYRFR